MTARDRAVAAWGATLPDWLDALVTACDARSLRKVAESLQVSPALVSLAIRNRHHARLDYIRSRVEAMLSVSIITCPVLGVIGVADCKHHQQQPFVSINPLAVRLYRACHGGCLYATIKEDRHDSRKDRV